MSSNSPASRVLAFVLLAASAVISYQAWTNSKLSKETAELAKQHACDLDSSCIVLDDSARVGAADIMRHRYEFNTTHGIVTVTCKREWIFFGGWACEVQNGQMHDKPMP